MKKLIEKIKKNIEATNVGLFEREEIVKLSYLAMFAGESVFMLGLPGVAKSLIARRMKYSIKEGETFEYLMNKFSTPEEIFGPISLKELDNDKYVRKIEGYLPNASVAFLDEIWKASPAIQNTLLTVINEKIFRNGSEDVKVPLQLLISASNELPQEGEGLEALYDRFLIRYYVSPASTEETFRSIISSKDEDKFDPKKFAPLTEKEIATIREAAKKILLTDEVFDFITSLKNKLNVQLKEQAPYVSDRRWKKIVNLMKVNALLSERKKLSFVDLPLIKHCIVESVNNEQPCLKVFEECLVDALTETTGFNLSTVDELIEEAKGKKAKGYINTKKHQSCEYQGEKFYSFIFSDEPDRKYWAQLNEEMQLVPQDSHKDRAIVFRTVIDVNKIADDGYRREPTLSISRWDLDAEEYNGRPMVPATRGTKKVNREILREAEELLSSATEGLASIKLLFSDELKKESSKKSLFTHNISYLLEKLGAYVNEDSKKKQQEVFKLIGEIHRI